MGDLTIIAISMSVLALTWAVVRMNERVEDLQKKLRRISDQFNRDTVGQRTPAAPRPMQAGSTYQGPMQPGQMQPVG